MAAVIHDGRSDDNTHGDVDPLKPKRSDAIGIMVQSGGQTWHRIQFSFTQRRR